MHGAAEIPGEHGAATAAQPEAAGEISPAGAGEQIGRGIFDGGVCRGDVRLFAGLVVEQEQQGEDVHRTDRRQQAGGLLILGVAQRAEDGEGCGLKVKSCREEICCTIQIQIEGTVENSSKSNQNTFLSVTIESSSTSEILASEQRDKLGQCVNSRIYS